MELATPDNRTPTTARAIEANYRALDPRIRRKLSKLAAEREAGFAVVDRLTTKLHQARQDLALKKQRLKDAIANAGPSRTGEGSSWGGPPPPERHQEIERLSEVLAEAETVYQAATERATTGARVHQACADWLEATPIDRVLVVPVPFRHVADPRAELSAIREQLVALAAEEARIEAAPVPTAEALTRLDALARDVTTRRASHITERARAFFSRDGVGSIAQLFGLVQGFAEAPRELTAAIVERCEADFVAELDHWKKAVRAQAVNGNAVPSADRPKRLAAITRQRHALEQHEEAIVLAAERDGLQLDRREDAEPAAVLCTVLGEPA